MFIKVLDEERESKRRENGNDCGDEYEKEVKEEMERSTGDENK